MEELSLEEESEFSISFNDKEEFDVNKLKTISRKEMSFESEEVEAEEISKPISYKKYYDSRWPKILIENRCCIKSREKCNIRDFDDLCFYGWGSDIEEEDECLPAVKRPDPSSEEDYQRLSLINVSEDYIDEKYLDEKFLQQVYRTPKFPIMPLEQHLNAIECDRKLREQLAKDFTLRDYPWYMKIPIYERNFNLTGEHELIFCDPFEYKILHNIYKYRTRFMIIFTGIDVPLGNYERWLKFKMYVAVIVVVKSQIRFQQLKNSACFHGVAISEEMDDNPWQDELARGLKAGVNIAKSLYIYRDHSVPFVYVFPNNRNICVVDNFKVLRHN